MAERVETRALVIQRFAFGESSQVVHLLTESLGRVVVLARGSWRPKNSYDGPLDLLVRGSVALSLVHGRELAVLVSRRVETSYPALRRDLRRFSAATHVLRRLVYFEPVGGGAGEAFRLADRALGALETIESARLPLLLLAFDLRLLAAHGLFPAVDQCVRCGSPRALARFVAGNGGIVCAACLTRPDEGERIDARTAELMRHLVETPLREVATPAPATLSLARRLVDLHLEWHADALRTPARSNRRLRTRG